MELLEIESRIIALEKLCDQALTRAINAEVEIKAIKESTHKIQFINPNAASEDIDYTPETPIESEKGTFQVSTEKELNKKLSTGFWLCRKVISGSIHLVLMVFTVP